jgi:hypothetical protein
MPQFFFVQAIFKHPVLGFINTGYFTIDMCPTELKMQPTIHFRKKLATAIKISSFFRKLLNTNKRLFNI